jgi:hypothetical protein
LALLAQAASRHYFILASRLADELGLILGVLALWTRERFTSSEDAAPSDAHEFVKS